MSCIEKYLRLPHTTILFLFDFFCILLVAFHILHVSGVYIKTKKTANTGTHTERPLTEHHNNKNKHDMSILT